MYCIQLNNKNIYKVRNKNIKNKINKNKFYEYKDINNFYECLKYYISNDEIYNITAMFGIILDSKFWDREYFQIIFNKLYYYYLTIINNKSINLELKIVVYQLINKYIYYLNINNKTNIYLLNSEINLYNSKIYYKYCISNICNIIINDNRLINNKISTDNNFLYKVIYNDEYYLIYLLFYYSININNSNYYYFKTFINNICFLDNCLLRNYYYLNILILILSDINYVNLGKIILSKLGYYLTNKEFNKLKKNIFFYYYIFRNYLYYNLDLRNIIFTITDNNIYYIDTLIDILKLYLNNFYFKNNQEDIILIIDSLLIKNNTNIFPKLFKFIRNNIIFSKNIIISNKIKIINILLSKYTYINMIYDTELINILLKILIISINKPNTIIETIKSHKFYNNIRLNIKDININLYNKI